MTTSNNQELLNIVQQRSKEAYTVLNTSVVSLLKIIESIDESKPLPTPVELKALLTSIFDDVDYACDINDCISSFILATNAVECFKNPGLPPVGQTTNTVGDHHE